MPSLGGVAALVGLLAVGWEPTLGGVSILVVMFSLAGESTLGGKGGAGGSPVAVSGRSCSCGSISAQDKQDNKTLVPS